MIDHPEMIDTIGQLETTDMTDVVVMIDIMTDMTAMIHTIDVTDFPETLMHLLEEISGESQREKEEKPEVLRYSLVTSLSLLNGKT